MTSADPVGASTAPSSRTLPLPRDGNHEPSPYWKAQPFADTVLAEFEAARRDGDLETLRERFYVLAAYYRRSLAILHSALDHRREGLAEAALRNLIVLQRALTAMREVAPDAAQSTLALESDVHQRVNRDLVHRILRDARGPLLPGTVLRRFNELDLIADARSIAIDEALKVLVQTGHAVERQGRYTASHRPYIDADVDRAGLVMLLGPVLARRFVDIGFEGLSHVLAKREEFCRRFQSETGFGSRAATVAAACAAILTTPTKALHTGGAWKHADLGGSSHPRPYQRLLHAVFRAHGYAAQVIEAPAGSGKTFIGMLCMEDWLRTMSPGQSILVLVPTVSYQQQWVGELSLKPAGLKMSPNLIFAGTPRGLEALRRRTGVVPAVLLITYAALTQTVSGLGKGGFDRAAIERFLQGNNVRHIILDEVHKVAAEPASSAAHVTRVFREWLRDGSLSSLIGFSGTLSAFQPQLHSLGLELAYSLPATELIGQGWVAPFAELGAPFNYSEREREVAMRIDEYKTLLRGYLRHIGGARLRGWFAAIPLVERTRIAASLGMYAGRRDAEQLIQERIKRWEVGGDLGLDEVLLVGIVQTAHGWSDRRMLEEAGAADASGLWIETFEEIRARLRPALPSGRLLSLLNVENFGDRIHSAAFSRAEQKQDHRTEDAKDLLATTFVGTYLALRGWSRQVGEGRVSAVRSIMAAEREARAISGVIVFDNPAPLQMKGGPVTPGFRGAGGMFAQILGDRSCVPMAALSSAVYLPDYPNHPVHEEIAEWVVRRVIGQEQRDALFALVAAGSGLDERRAAEIRPVFEQLYGAYVRNLTERGATRIRDFDQQVLQPLRHAIREAHLGRTGTSVLNLLSLDHHHLRSSVTALISYAAIATAFRGAHSLEVIQGNGRPLEVRVVPVPGGRRRQLLLDLTGRIIDSDELPVDLIIVSDWARTGWNVITPNVLIDATATRDVTAWQQLRGRAMRPAPTWSGVAQRLVQHLLGSSAEGPEGTERPIDSKAGQLSFSHLPSDEVELAEQVLRETRQPMEDGPEFGENIAVSLMVGRNKVTHVYELIRAYGTRPQVEYNRSGRHWDRSAAITDKHRREAGVRSEDGAYLPGPSHAPLIVAADPRRDLPSEFQERLGVVLAGADERIVRGWLRVAAGTSPGTPEATAGASDDPPVEC